MGMTTATVPKKRGRPPKAAAEKKAAPRGRVQEWMRGYADRQRPSVKIPDVAKAALEHFEKTEPGFLVELAKRETYALLYQIAQATLAEGRSISIGNGEVVRSLGDARAAAANRARSIFDGWTEHVGDRNVYLKEMDRDLLAAASQMRHARMEAENIRWRFLCQIREGLPKNKKVGEYYTDADLHALWERLNPKEKAS